MVKAFTKQIFTLEEYFELEKSSEDKWEFWDGHVWCMSGASFAHEDIVSNTIFLLHNRLPKGCRISGSNVKVMVPEYPPYRYPDMTVVCGERKEEIMGGLQVLTNPQMIIEVLSPSTEAFDRGDKFTYYKSIPSLTDYVLISTSRPSVMRFRKSSESEWSHTEANGRGASIDVDTFGIEPVLSEIYLDVEFPEPVYRSPEEERFM